MFFFILSKTEYTLMQISGKTNLISEQPKLFGSKVIRA